MAQTEVAHTCEDRKWKERSIFSMLNSLMAKGVLREVGGTAVKPTPAPLSLPCPMPSTWPLW